MPIFLCYEERGSQREGGAIILKGQGVVKTFLYSMARWLYKNAYKRIMPDGTAETKALLVNCTSILDIGCGETSPLRYLPTDGKFKVGVDVYEAAKNRYHDEYQLLNALDIEVRFGSKSFDCVCAFDIVEHLPKNESAALIEAMERVARKVVIISTPNGYVPWAPSGGNPYQAHRSGWTVEEMRARDYIVLGTCGWRRLRNRYNWLGPFHDGRFFHLQNFVFDITQILVKKRPELAYQLLCFKALCPEA